MKNAAKTAATVTALALALVLAACAPAAQEAAPAPSTTTREISSEPTPPAPEPVAEPAADPVPEPEAFEHCPPSAIAYDGLAEPLTLTDETVLTDSGTRPGAQGQVSLDDNGNPAAYLVAPGDTQDGIAQRFCAAPGYLSLLNSVRRDDVYIEPPAGSWPNYVPGTGWVMDLYAGDTLNLNPHTVMSVGDQNGVVHANEPDIAMPPQW